MKLISRVKYRRRILLSYIFLATITLILVFSLMFVNVRTIASNNISFTSTQSISQVSDYVGYLMENHSQYALSFAYNSTVWPIVGKDADSYPLNEQMADKRALENLLNNFATYAQTKTRFTCTLYLNDEFAYTSNWGIISKFSVLTQTDSYQKMITNKQTIYSTYENDMYPGDSIVTIHLICREDDYSSRPAAFTLSYPAEVLRNILQNALPTPNSTCVIIDRYGDTLIGVGRYFDNQDIDLEAVQEALTTDDCLVQNDGRIWSRYISGCNWYIAYYVPNSDIYASYSSHVWTIAIGVLAIGILMLLLSNLLSNTITKRIVLLSQKMSNELNTTPTPIVYERKGDDIDCVFEQYNAMVQHINTLLDENQKKTRALASAELNLLHVQINPHFLFNTLDMLHWMIADNRFDLVSDTIDKLSDFYRIGLSKGDMLIPLKNELKHTLSYVDIQNARFDKKIKINVNVPDQYMSILLPRITLQPIVENSIVHGLQNLSNRDAELTITAVRENNDLIISVCDNGIGIPHSKMEMLLEENSRNLSHYGLYNTHKRLQMHFSDSYGLSVYSIPNKMTQVDIRVPFKE